MWLQTAVLFLIIVPCVVTDIKSHTLPAPYLLAGAILGVIVNVLTGETGALMMTFGLLSGIILILLSAFKRNAVGSGDGILVGAIGVTIGGFETVTVLVSGLLLLGITGLCLCLRHKQSIKSRLAFAPFLAVGCVLERTVYIIARLAG